MILAGASLLGVAALVYSQDAKSKLTSAELEKKITRDTAEIRNANPAMAGFADVVERILPSVVSINTFSKKAQRRGFTGSEDELDQLPPMLRPFFEDYLQRHGDGQPANPRNRQSPQRPQKPVQTGLGSGMLLTDDGYILTNNHVVDGADELKVIVAGKSREYTAKVIGADPSTDVALIKIEGTGFPHATIGDSSKLRVGETVLAVGAPMGLEQSVTHGIVSALGRSGMGIIGSKRGGEAGYENFIQTDAAINPGNSGGPLVDAQGRVIGINSAIETQSGMFAGIGLAIPINMAMSVVHDLVETGKVQRGFLGIQMDSVEPSMSDFLGLKDEYGVTVSRIVDGSPAAKAGFEEGDVIVSADGMKIADPTKLRLMISSHPPGSAVKFGVVRFNESSKKAERKEIVAKLEKLPDQLSSAFEKIRPTPGKDKGAGNVFLEGVKVEELNDELRENYKIEAEVKGVVVTNVDEKSPAAMVGLQEGDVITQVNRKAVSNVPEARSNKGEAGGAVQLKIVRAGQTKFLVVKS